MQSAVFQRLLRQMCVDFHGRSHTKPQILFQGMWVVKLLKAKLATFFNMGENNILFFALVFKMAEVSWFTFSRKIILSQISAWKMSAPRVKVRQGYRQLETRSPNGKCWAVITGQVLGSGATDLASNKHRKKEKSYNFL